jgi:hypothetical protein
MLPARLRPTWVDGPDSPDTEEVTGSNPVRPSRYRSSEARFRPGNLAFLTLLWLSSCWVLHEPVEAAGEVALDAAADFAGGFAFGGAAGCVGDGGRVVAEPAQGDGVQGAVGGAVAVGVEAVAVGAAGGGGDGCGAGEGGEGGFGAEPAGVGPRW